MLVNIDGKQDYDFNKRVYIAGRAVLIKGQGRDQANFFSYFTWWKTWD